MLYNFPTFSFIKLIDLIFNNSMDIRKLKFDMVSIIHSLCYIAHRMRTINNNNNNK